MDKNPSKPADRHATRATAEESLNEALNDLEQLLDRRQGAAKPTGASTKPKKPATAGAAATPRKSSDGAQYTIPLLHDVVVPGEDTSEPDSPRHASATSLPDSDDMAEVCEKLIERLANEVEVIVQAKVEAAVQGAMSDIREQVRNHLDIVLPEILDELRELTRHRRR